MFGGVHAMLRRRSLLTGIAAAPFVPALPYVARATEAPGVTSSEIRIGSTAAYSGPRLGLRCHRPCSYRHLALAQRSRRRQRSQGEFHLLRRLLQPAESGGAGSPPDRARHPGLLSNTLGTATNSAIVKYVNQKKVPDLFVGSGADKWGDYRTSLDHRLAAELPY